MRVLIWVKVSLRAGMEAIPACAISLLDENGNYKPGYVKSVPVGRRPDGAASHRESIAHDRLRQACPKSHTCCCICDSVLCPSVGGALVGVCNYDRRVRASRAALWKI